MTRPMMNKTRKTTKRIHAICVAAPAIPLSPKIPAISAITKNVIAQFNMNVSSFHPNSFGPRCYRAYMRTNPSIPVTIKYIATM